MIGPANPGAVIAASLGAQSTDPRRHMMNAQEPFVWGAGGQRMTPDAIARQREIAQSLMQSDYSPVGSVWEGLGRVVDNVRGALQSRKADKAERESQAYSQNQIAQLLSGGGLPSASVPPGSPQSSGPGGNLALAQQIIADPYADQGAKAIATMQLEQQQKMALKQFERDSQTWTDNAGNRWRLGANGMPEIVFYDRNQKTVPQLVTDESGAQFMQYVPIPNAYNPDGTPANNQTGPAVGAVEDGYRFTGGDPADKSNWVPVDGSAPPVSQAPQSGNVVDAAGYRAIAESLGGNAEADAFLRRNGLTKGQF